MRSLGFAVLLACACPLGWSIEVGAAGPAERDRSPESSARVLQSVAEIWALPEAQQAAWHRVKFEYTVYYYDPLWMALWGRNGESDTYLSFGPKRFPIKPGQRLLVQGLMQPSRGMRVDEAEVQVLTESVPIEVLRTQGQIARAELFNKRLVTVDGYVDRQVARDANHLELHLVTEGRVVLAQLLVSADERVPQLTGTFVHAKGVYFGRSDEAGAGTRIELWIQRQQDLEVTGTIERDPRFAQPVVPVAKLAGTNGTTVHLSGTAGIADAGKSIRLQTEGATILIETPQMLAVRPGDAIEAVGEPALEGEQWVLRQALVRPTQHLFTSVADLWALPETERRRRRTVRLEMTVYYYDAPWKALWGSNGDSGEYVSLGEREFPIRTGQRILIEGSVVPANGMTVEDPSVTILADAVPLEAVSTRGEIGNVEKFQRRLVTVEGYVDRQQTIDPRHVQLDLIVEGRPVIGRVLLSPNAPPPPDWTDALLRLTGVYSATQDPTGARPSLEIWTPGPGDVTVLGTLARDERFSRPITPIEQISTVGRGAVIKVVGSARGQQPGRLFVRDETGQVTVHSAQARPVRLGEMIEAVGTVSSAQGEWQLQDAVYRPSQVAPPPPAETLPKLRLADQLRELQPEDAAKGYPVQLMGIVTWARPNADFFYVHDSSGGACVYRPPGSAISMYVGTKIEVSGISAAGKFTPVVLAETVQTSASMELPEARPVTLEQALTGVEEAEWVTMSGYVRAISTDGPWVRANLTTSGGEFSALLPPHERWSKLPGAIVRIRGVCAAIANDKRQLVGIQVWVPSHRFVEVEEAPADLYATPLRSIASLRQFSTLPALNRRVRVAGTVVHHAPGRVIHVQDGAEGLMVLSRERTPLALGDRIEAVGLPGRENSRVVLREAVYRRIAAGSEPTALAVPRVAPVAADLDGRLVRVEATLLSIGDHQTDLRMIVQQRDSIFEAVLEQAGPRPADLWVPRSQLALTGVYDLRFDEYRRPSSVRILLRTPGDVVVLRQPPWWTVRRALGAAAVLTLVLLLGFGWLLVLRRRVHHQTGVIREQVESEKAARLEAALARASKLESLGVLAGGIAHDFNNLLTVVLGNLSLARLDARVPADTLACLADSERAATRARDLTQQLLTFAKGGEPIKTSTRLAEIVREAAEFGLHGSKVRCEFDFAADLWPAHVDRSQTGQVVHNLIINATQAMPGGGVVRLRLRNEEIQAPRGGLAVGRYVRLSVTDTGHGIAPDTLGRIFEPYFTTKRQGNGLGLATVYSIVKKHQGQVEVTSKVGEGTTFDVWLPAADSPPAPAPQPAANPLTAGARVLLMDDEPSIRSLGTAVLRRMGLQPTVVADGQAAVADYIAAREAGRRYDLVILDLTVPGGMGGAEAMTRLQEVDPDVRAIVSSGYSKDPVMARYADHGFCARVPKPYQASELMAAVRAALGNPGA